MFGSSSAAQDACNRYGVWTGNCFGMVTSAASFYKSANFSDANANLSVDSDISFSDFHLPLREYIEAMQILQCSASHQKVENRNTNAYGSLVSAVMDFQQTGPSRFSSASTALRATAAMRSWAWRPTATKPTGGTSSRSMTPTSP